MQLQNTNLFKTSAFIGGKWVSSISNVTYPILDPATQKVIAHVPDLDESLTNEAVAAAHRSFNEWKSYTARERSNTLRKWYDLIVKNSNDLAAIMTLESGKPLAESKGEVAYGASFINWFAEEAPRLYGNIIPQNTNGSF